MKTYLGLLFALACGLSASGRPFDGAAQGPPARISVLPVFFVASDAAPPTDAQKALLRKHLGWTQRRYGELLRGSTFQLDPGPARVHRSTHPRAYYEALPEGGAPQYVAEMLEELGCSRADCPYVFVVVFMSPDRDFPGGGGRPINGGNNAGGGVVILSSFGLDKAPNFQSTLQHELGHAFGLPHVDVYGYSMADNPSMMSYNPKHLTDGFKPSATPGAFIPEDLRALALNQRAFPGLTFDPKRDVPAGYAMRPDIVTLGPMVIPGHPLEAVRPKIGLWLTVWWTSDDKYKHWVNCHVFPKRGRYTEGDPAVVKEHYARFRDMGIDFLIMDDTNGYGNDGGRIADNIRAWFDFMDALPAAERIPICIGGGGEMRDSGKLGQQKAADYYWTNWAQRPSYFKLDGKPLLLVDTDKNYGPGDFTDKRFTVRWAYNGDNHAAMQVRKTWGWGCIEPAPVLDECMSIWPGHRFPKRVAEAGIDPDEAPREGGDMYARMWLSALKARPRYVTIADWNNFEEESALEDSYSWVDRWGYAVPDLYVRITRAYSRLREDKLVKGEYYAEEAKPDVFLFDGSRLVPQEAVQRRACLIIAPAGMLDRIGAALK